LVLQLDAPLVPGVPDAVEALDDEAGPDESTEASEGDRDE
jgi:hypothetical protein